MSHGGYRKGSGRAKTGYYNGIYCGSTYELVWVIYQINHNLEFERFSGHLEYEGKKYFPDFLQNGKIIEIKGYESIESVAEKTKVANMNGYDVIVLRKPQLENEFLWVCNKYNTKNYAELYDDYKPKYTYSCDSCGVLFNRDKKSKYNKIFCSRKCSMKNNRTTSGKNQYTKQHSSIG